MSCNLLYYFIHLDSEGFPIPGTMYAKKQARINTCGQLIAPVTGTVMNAPAGEVQCFPRNGFRYWYQVKSTESGPVTIVPNSFIAVHGIPTHTGGRACQFLEFKIFKTIGS